MESDDADFAPRAAVDLSDGVALEGHIGEGGHVVRRTYVEDVDGSPMVPGAGGAGAGQGDDVGGQGGASIGGGLHRESRETLLNFCKSMPAPGRSIPSHFILPSHAGPAFAASSPFLLRCNPSVLAISSLYSLLFCEKSHSRRARLFVFAVGGRTLVEQDIVVRDAYTGPRFKWEEGRGSTSKWNSPATAAGGGGVGTHGVGLGWGCDEREVVDENGEVGHRCPTCACSHSTFFCCILCRALQ